MKVVKRRCLQPQVTAFLSLPELSTEMNWRRHAFSRSHACWSGKWRIVIFFILHDWNEVSAWIAFTMHSLHAYAPSSKCLKRWRAVFERADCTIHVTTGNKLV